MPREARLFIKGACYHVMSRGINKMQTFLDDEDYEKYINFIAKYKRRFAFKLYGWCGMPNHPHLIISSDSLSKVMHMLNFSYAQYFNNKYERVGYLWQDRFKSYVVQKDRYLINLISYIEYNPVRANIVSNPEDYRWSSYQARLLGEDEFSILDRVEF